MTYINPGPSVRECPEPGRLMARGPVAAQESVRGNIVCVVHMHSLGRLPAISLPQTWEYRYNNAS